MTREAILIIELMCQLNMEDFQIDQWMFLFDGYGIEDKEIKVEAPDIDQETRFGVVDGKFSFRSKDTFQPFMTQFMCRKPQPDKDGKIDGELMKFSQRELHFYKVDNGHQESKNTWVQRPDEAQIKTGGDLKDLELEICRYVRGMQSALSVNNTKRTEINRVAAEKLIEKEFIIKK